MNESEIQELERIIDEQQERIDALEEALSHIANPNADGGAIDKCPASVPLERYYEGIAGRVLDRQQAGGSHE